MKKNNEYKEINYVLEIIDFIISKSFDLKNIKFDFKSSMRFDYKKKPQICNLDLSKKGGLFKY